MIGVPWLKQHWARQHGGLPSSCEHRSPPQSVAASGVFSHVESHIFFRFVFPLKFLERYVFGSGVATGASRWVWKSAQQWRPSRQPVQNVAWLLVAALPNETRNCRGRPHTGAASVVAACVRAWRAALVLFSLFYPKYIIY